jgi:oligopeptidase A
MVTITTRRPTYRDNLASVEADLATTAARLRTLVTPISGLSAAPLTEEALREVILLYANAAYTFAYLEGSQRFADYQHLLRWYDAFFRNRELADATEKALALAGPFAAAEMEELRLTWLAWFADCRQASVQAQGRQTELEAAMRDVLRRMDTHQLAFLQRLGIDTSRASPSVALAETASRIESPVTRTKLTTAWRRHVASDVTALTDLLDEAVEARRHDVRNGAGEHTSVLDRTFARCSVPPAEAASFLQAFLARALETQHELESAVRAATGCDAHPMDHFGRYLRVRMGDARLVTLRLEACLDLLFTIASRVLGVTVAPSKKHAAHALTFRVARRDEELGTIDFDLLSPGATAVRPSPGPAFSSDRTLEPAQAKAHVLCPLHPVSGGGHRITLAAAQTIFHEFGHALTHILLRRRLPSASGIGHLPLERLECASTWWERWTYHPDFVGVLDPAGGTEEDLASNRQLRTLETWSTTLQCTVAAAVDFDVHARQEGGHRTSYERLSRELSLGDHCTFADLPGYLTHLTWQAAPGAGFLYLWGAASSAEVFGPYRRVRVEDLPATGMPNEPAHLWLDSTLSSPRPSVEAYFASLRDVLDAGPAEVLRT